MLSRSVEAHVGNFSEKVHKLLGSKCYQGVLMLSSSKIGWGASRLTSIECGVFQLTTIEWGMVFRHKFTNWGQHDEEFTKMVG